MPFFNVSDCLTDEGYAIIKNYPEVGNRLLPKHALESASLTIGALKEIRAAVSSISDMNGSIDSAAEGLSTFAEEIGCNIRDIAAFFNPIADTANTTARN